AFVRQEDLAQRVAAVARAGQVLSEARERAEAESRALIQAEAKWEPGNPRAFADPLCTVLAFQSKLPVAPELTQARDAVESVRLALRIAEAEHASALVNRDSLGARIAADDVRYGRSQGDRQVLCRDASGAGRRATVARSAFELAKAEQTLALARGKSSAEVAKATTIRDKARKSQETACLEAEKDSSSYTSISPLYPAKSSGRRAALARWITDRANPLTARVAVNHLWRWHFGTPLVATTHDFGRNGPLPTHPALLDWLAVELMEPTAPGAVPWSMKALHRRIVTSAAYRMGSHPIRANDAGRSIDPANRDYWRFPAARMEAEEVRDSLLQVAGVLDSTPGGPDIDQALGLTSRRRSVYFTHHGESRMPFLELFDSPDVCDAYRRTTTVVPQQALALVNNELLLELS